MNEIQKDNIIDSYSNFRNHYSSIINDLTFWINFTKRSIDQQQKNGDPNQTLFSSAFATYDSAHNSNEGWLKMHPDIFQLKVSDLQRQGELFCSWLMNLSLVRAYNINEIMLLHLIELIFFEGVANPWEKKKSAQKIEAKIGEWLKSNRLDTDKTNNRHIIRFIMARNSHSAAFLQQNVKIDSTVSRQQFLALFGILRNIVSHHHMMVEIDTLNNIKGVAGEQFKRYFKLKSEAHNISILDPIPGKFLDFLNINNEIVTNIVKFAAGEKDLSFLQLTN